MRAQPPAERSVDHVDGAAERFALDFRTRSDSLARMRRSFDAWLTGAGVDDDVAYDLLLALNEAVSNSIEHAYPPGVDGTVLVKATLASDGAVCVVVSDDGRWRVPPAALSGRGRGLLLMRENVDQVVVDRTSAGTSVSLCRSPRPRRSEALEAPPDGHEVLVEERGSGVRVTVRGDVPASAGAALRRSLLTAARGGSVPVVVDLGGIGAETAGAVHAVFSVADAACAAGNRLVVLAEPGTPAWTALAESGVPLVADVVSPTGR